MCRNIFLPLRLSATICLPQSRAFPSLHLHPTSSQERKSEHARIHSDFGAYPTPFPFVFLFFSTYRECNSKRNVSRKLFWEDLGRSVLEWDSKKLPPPSNLWENILRPAEEEPTGANCLGDKVEEIEAKKYILRVNLLKSLEQNLLPPHAPPSPPLSLHAHLSGCGPRSLAPTLYMLLCLTLRI